MSEEGNGGSNFGFFLAGLGMGAILALLLAPQSGKETREYIAGKAEEGRDYVRPKRKTCVAKRKRLSRKARIL